MDNLKWAHQDRVGYIFLEPATVNLSNQIQTGRWSDITDQKNISDTLVSEEVFAIWLDHGNRPRNASYQYLVVPNVTEQQLSEISQSNRGVKVLSNTSEMQAVEHSGLGISQIVFFRAGVVEITDGTEIGMGSQGMAMAKMEGDRIKELSVSDPSRTLSSITMTVSGIYDSQGENFSTRPNRSKNSTTITIKLPLGVYAGRSVTVRL